MIILGIETSCDETSVALLRADKGRFSVLSNIVSSQVKIHAKYGGVVPEVAARKHAENMMPVLKEALKTAKIKSSRGGPTFGGKDDVDVIAVTYGPGLAISLLVGVETARTLAYALKKKLVGVNHIEAHILANSLLNKKIKFPAICLVVSGGHTQLVLIKDYGKYKIIGETVDDAVGECFDKVAKILGLGYPGGPIISKLAEKGNANAYKLPRPMEKSGDFNFSFSGLKTAVLYLVKELTETRMRQCLIPTDAAKKNVGTRHRLVQPKIIADISASFEEAATDVLVQKTISASKKFNAKTVMIAGGVSANKKLRKKMGEALKEFLPKTEYLIPEFSYCTDNAAMIAVAGYFKAKAKKFTKWDKIDIEPNLRLK